jgi:hypothetical protein
MRYWAWQARPTRLTSLVRACMLGLLIFLLHTGQTTHPNLFFKKLSQTMCRLICLYLSYYSGRKIRIEVFFYLKTYFSTHFDPNHLENTLCTLINPSMVSKGPKKKFQKPEINPKLFLSLDLFFMHFQDKKNT